MNRYTPPSCSAFPDSGLLNQNVPFKSPISHILGFFFHVSFSLRLNELFRLFCASIHQLKYPQTALRLLQHEHWFLIRCLALNSSLFTRLQRRIPHLHSHPTISPFFGSICTCSSATEIQQQNKSVT